MVKSVFFIAKIDFINSRKEEPDTVLKSTPLPELYNCATKHFLPNELHITRICRQNVLILMWSGILRFRENGTDRELREGEYYIQRAGLLQEGILPCDTPVYFYIHFYGHFSENGIGLPITGTFRKSILRPLCEQMEKMSPNKNTDPFALHAQMYRIFSALSADTAPYEEPNDLAYRLKTYLDIKYTEPAPLFELSHRFGYTTDHLIRIFRTRYGITPHRYLNAKRMDHARWLLETTEHSVEQIAAAVGYTDFSAFYRAFRKAHGAPPGSFRKRKE